jgi:hypothetical protein
MEDSIPKGIDGEIWRVERTVEDLKRTREKYLENPSLYQPLIDHAERVWENDQFVWEWLCRPTMRLDNMSPMDALASGLHERVEQLLGAIEYGVYL